MAFEELIRNSQANEIWTKYNGWTNRKIIAPTPTIPPGEKTWGEANEDLLTLDQSSLGPIELPGLGGLSSIPETVDSLWVMNSANKDYICRSTFVASNYSFCKKKKSANRKKQQSKPANFYIEFFRETHNEKVYPNSGGGDIYVEVEVIDVIAFKDLAGNEMTLVLTNPQPQSAPTAANKLPESPI